MLEIFILKHQKTLSVTRSSFLCPGSGTGNGIMQCFDNKRLQKNYARTVIFLIVNLILDPGQVDNLIFNWYTLLYLTRVHIWLLCHLACVTRHAFLLYRNTHYTWTRFHYFQMLFSYHRLSLSLTFNWSYYFFVLI